MEEGEQTCKCGGVARCTVISVVLAQGSIRQPALVSGYQCEPCDDDHLSKEQIYAVRRFFLSLFPLGEQPIFTLPVRQF